MLSTRSIKSTSKHFQAVGLNPTYNLYKSSVNDGCSGFINFGDKVVYISTDVPYKTYERVLVRFAKDEKDFTGGQNYFCEFPTNKNPEKVKMLSDYIIKFIKEVRFN